MWQPFEQYVHTLIPRDSRCAPHADQVGKFLDAIVRLGASPRYAKFILSTPSDSVRWFTNPVSGERKSFPHLQHVPLENTSNLSSLIERLPQYDVRLEGDGPPKTPAFPVYTDGKLFTERYSFTVRCSLKPEPVSISEHRGEPEGSPFFGSPCDHSEKPAVFRHPVNGRSIETVGPACTRFWVEFEFGKWLLPEINDSLEILNPAIVSMARDSFGMDFAQGFHLL
jgi:hypothetical protein